MSKNYSDKQKIAYYKKMALANKSSSAIQGRGAYSKKSAPRAIRGRGAYTDAPKRPKKTALQGIAKYAPLAGGSLGSALGGPVGGMLGTAAGQLFNHFFGRGDYQVQNNCFLKDGQLMEPIINPHKSGGDVFRRSEYLTDVITSSSANTFNLQNYPINPGLDTTFEWLSQLACNYEEYSIEGMYFEFRSMSADALNSTNTALGQVILACNYNAASSNFANKMEMENYEGGISSKPSISTRYFVECEPHRSVLDNLYVRQGSVPSGQDQRMYDLGNFQIATNGFQGTSVNIGELWVTYQVCLRKPKLFAALGNYNSHFYGINPTYTNANPIGTGTLATTFSNIQGFSASGTTIKWNAPTLPQNYFVEVTWNGSVAAAVVYPTVTASNGFTVVGLTTSPNTPTSTTIAVQYMAVTYQPSLNTSGGQPTLTYGGGGTLPTTPVNVSIRVFQTPNLIAGI